MGAFLPDHSVDNIMQKSLYNLRWLNLQGCI